MLVFNQNDNVRYKTRGSQRNSRFRTTFSNSVLTARLQSALLLLERQNPNSVFGQFETHELLEPALRCSVLIDDSECLSVQRSNCFNDTTNRNGRCIFLRLQSTSFGLYGKVIFVDYEKYSLLWSLEGYVRGKLSR